MNKLSFETFKIYSVTRLDCATTTYMIYREILHKLVSHYQSVHHMLFKGQSRYSKICTAYVIHRKFQSKNQKGRARLEDVGLDNIKVNFIERGCEGVDWINLVQDQWRVFVYSALRDVTLFSSVPRQQPSRNLMPSH
jgi:hypothetical protein